MKRTYPAIACLILVMAQYARSQEELSGYPFIVPADPRSFAMGESFTALPANPSALLYNPAGLAGLSGIHLSYSQRSQIGDYHSTLRSFNAVVGTPFGVFGAQLNHDFYGVLPITISNDGLSPVSAYDYDIGIGYALGLGRGFSAGGAVKYYESRGLDVLPSTDYFMWSGSTKASLYDIGLMYTFRRFHSQEMVEDSITIGMSYQDIGSGKSSGTTSFNAAEFDIPEFAQYFRTGLSYALRVVPRRAGDASPFQAVFSGEYRSGQSAGAMDAAGFGMEFTIDEILSVRAGGLYWSAVQGVHIRYGAGVRLPFRSLGFDLAVQGAVIPWYSLYAFSIDVQFPACPWD